MKYREKIETRRGTIAGRNIRSLAFLGIFLIVGVCLIAGKILYERNIEVYTNYAYSDAHLIADSISGITPTKYLETQTKDAEYYDIRYTFMTAGIYQDEFRDFYLVVPTEDDLIYISEIYHNLPEGMEDLSKDQADFLEHKEYRPGEKEIMMDLIKRGRGEPDRELAAFKPEGYVGMVPPNDAWAALIEECWPDADKVTRYFIRKDTRFDREKLEAIVAALPEDYELRRIDGELYDALLESEDFGDNVCHFASKEQYLALGRGFAVLKDGEPVSVASSYIVYRGGIDIQIDTEEAYRRKGLATVAGAALILSCLDDGLYPSWDAANLGSVHLAEKLGYELSHEYPCYWLDKLLDRVIPNPDKSGWDALCGRWERQTEDRKIFEVLRKGADLYVKFISRKGEPLELKLFPVGENSFGLPWSDDELVFTEGGMTVDGQSCKKL